MIHELPYILSRYQKYQLDIATRNSLTRIQEIYNLSLVIIFIQFTFYLVVVFGLFLTNSQATHFLPFVPCCPFISFYPHSTFAFVSLTRSKPSHSSKALLLQRLLNSYEQHHSGYLLANSKSCYNYSTCRLSIKKHVIF